MSEKGPQACRVAAMNLLARREHSVRELCNKLKSREFEKDVIDEVLAVLQHECLLSDERFTQEYVRYRSNKGIGPVRLRQELAERGIGANQADVALAEYDWRPKAADVRLKKFGQALPENFKDRAKQMRFLQYRGFTTEQIQQAFNDDWE